MTTTLTELDELLAEPAEAAAARARTAFDRAAAPLADRLVLFGAGKLGRRTLAGLRRAGITPVAFADNDPGKWGRDLDGLPVLPPSEAADRHGSRAAFVVTIWGGDSPHRFEHSATQLAALGCQRVVPFTLLYWRHAAELLPWYCQDRPERVLHAAAQVHAAMGCWSDAPSRELYLAHVRWRLTGDSTVLPGPVGHPQYLPDDLYARLDDEVLVDCGAFDGDSTRAFLAQRGDHFGGVVMLEPDPANLARIAAWRDRLPPGQRRRIEVLPLAVGASREIAWLEATGTVESALTHAGNPDALAVECAPLDDILRGRPATLIKMDIEGAEPAAVAGAAELIGGSRPVLAVSVYHQQDHLWSVPLQLAALADRYRFHLRPHNEGGWDLVCYAVPEERALDAGPAQ